MEHCPAVNNDYDLLVENLIALAQGSQDSLQYVYSNLFHTLNEVLWLSSNVPLTPKNYLSSKAVTRVMPAGTLGKLF